MSITEKVSQNSKESKQQRTPAIRWGIATRATITTLVALFIALIVFFICGYYYGWPWVGVWNYSAVTYRTLWDWMSLLVVPLVLALSAFVLDRTVKAAETEREEQRIIAEKELTENRQQEDLLQQYIDYVSNALQNVQSGNEEDLEQFQVTLRVRTLSAIRRLNSVRNKVLFEFLRDLRYASSKSLGYSGSYSLVDLSGSDLSGVDLEGAKLGTNLSECKLINANLKDVDLAGCILVKADLTDAILEGARLHECDLSEAQFVGANLSNADITAVVLQNANFTKANFVGAEISGRGFKTADFTSAIMPDGSTFESWSQSNKSKMWDYR